MPVVARLERRARTCDTLSAVAGRCGVNGISPPGDVCVVGPKRNMSGYDAAIFAVFLFGLLAWQHSVLQFCRRPRRIRHFAEQGPGRRPCRVFADAYAYRGNRGRVRLFARDGIAGKIRRSVDASSASPGVCHGSMHNGVAIRSYRAHGRPACANGLRRSGAGRKSVARII